MTLIIQMRYSIYIKNKNIMILKINKINVEE